MKIRYKRQLEQCIRSVIKNDPRIKAWYFNLEYDIFNMNKRTYTPGWVGLTKLRADTDYIIENFELNLIMSLKYGKKIYLLDQL